MSSNAIASKPLRTWTRRSAGIRLEAGPGTLAQLGTCAADAGMQRPLLVTDPGVRASGHVDVALGFLRDAGLAPELFDEVKENPTESLIERGAKLASASSVDGLIGLGGGSALDCAKGINFILTNGGRMRDYRGHGKTVRPLLPSIGIPTTAGTGSEAQSYALISHDETHAKMACGADDAMFRTILLDPRLVATVPAATMAAAGLDAISHALESFVCRTATPMSRMYAKEAWQLLSRGFERSVAVAGDRDEALDELRLEMQLGAFLAGAAIEQSMLGAAHAAANPLTSRHGIIHGAAVLLMLPHVIRFNAADGADPYSELGASADSFANQLERLRSAVGLPASLGAVGVSRDELSELAEEAATQWTAAFNPRPVGTGEFEELYEAAY